jgi:signal transduction histidine kinase
MPVDINLLLEVSLANSGSLFSNVDEPLALDVTVLRISLDEIISNALKYRRRHTPLDIVARYASGVRLPQSRMCAPQLGIYFWSPWVRVRVPVVFTRFWD